MKLRSTESLSKEKAALFDWQQDTSSVPYYQQGNRKYESAGIMEQRNKIKHASSVREAINRFWQLLPKNSSGHIEKQYYIELCLRFSKLLLPDFSRDESLSVIEEDWEADSEGCPSLSYSQFYNAVFQLADLWTEEILPTAYSDFLLKIFRRITCKKVIDDGVVVMKKPVIQLVFPDELQRELDWEVAESDEEYDEEYEYNYEVNEKGERKRTKRLKALDTLPDMSGLHYDEIVLADWEKPECGEVIELTDLDEIIPLGQVAEQYLASFSKKGAEMFVEVSKVQDAGKLQETFKGKLTGKVPETAKLQEIAKKQESFKVSEPSKAKEEVKVQEEVKIKEEAKEAVSAKIPEVSKGSIKIQEVEKKPEFQKTIVVISEVTKHRIKQQLSSSFISLKKSIIRVEEDNLGAAKPSTRKTIHDFSMSFLRSDNKEAPVSIEHQEKQTIQELRKTMLQAKYQPVIKRLERKISMQVKKGLIEVERDRKRIIIQEVDDSLPSVPALSRLYSAETELPTDPYMSTTDIISYSLQETIKILIVGPPRCGRTSLSEDISKSLDLHHIEISSIIARLLARGKTDEENEVEDEDEPKPEIYNEFEKGLIETLLSGDCLSTEQVVELVHLELLSDNSLSKGFILDIPLVSPYLELIHSQRFNLIVHMAFSQDDIQLQTTGIKWDFTTNSVYTTWHIAEILKPIPKKDDEDEEPAEDLPPKIVFENLLGRAEDERNCYQELLNAYFGNIEPVLEKYFLSLPESFKMSVKAAGLSPDQRKEIVLAKLGHRKNKPSAAKKLEGEANAKALLLQEVEENQEPRSFTIWKQVDPVALHETKLIQGKPDFPAEFSGNVFLFDSEINQEKFIKNPQKYLKTQPCMPEDFRLCILGPKRSGKHTQAEYLCAKYGWKLLDMTEILKQALQGQRKHLKNPQPSHPDSGLVQVPGEEFHKIMLGDSLPGNLILPIILHKLGIPLQKRPPPPPTPKSEQEEEEKPPSEPEEKSEEEEEEAGNIVDGEIKEAGEELEQDPESIVDKNIEKVTEENPEEALVEEPLIEREPTPPIVYDDLPLNDIVLKPGTDGLPKVKGFVMIGFPFTEEEAVALKEFNIEFDKILYFVDPNDGETLIQRGAEEFVDISKELALMDQAVAVVKEAFGDENVIEIQIAGTEDQVHEKICKSLDPFYIQLEDPDNVISKEEAGELAIAATFGEYGPYDPVVLTEQNWLMKGADEFEVQSLGKRYTFVSEVEMEKFKNSSKNQYITVAPTQVPQPHITVTGPRGSGVQTVLSQLSEKYQLPSFNLKKIYLEYLEEEKFKRRKNRLLKRGFVPKETNDDDEPYDPLLHDPDITEEDEGFDRALSERSAMQKVLQGTVPYIINSKWFEVDEEKVSQGLVDLLFESRRLPEFAVILRATEQTTMERLLDKEGITNKYQELMEIRRKEKEKAREEAKKEKLQARMERIAAGEEIEDEEEEVEEDDGDDPEAPNLENMLDEAKQKLIEMRDSDNTAIDEAKEAYETRGIPILEISTELPLQRLMQKITHELGKVMVNRSSLIERNLPIKLVPTKAQELLKKSKAKISCFGNLCPVTPEFPISQDFPVLFRDRIYYPGSTIDQEKFVTNPWPYLTSETNPKDVDLRALCAVLGGPCCGKSTLSKDLNSFIGVVRVGLRSAVQDILFEQSDLAVKVREELSDGKELSEAIMVDVISWRLGLADVLERGAVLDGFPKTSAQAVALANRGFLPSPVIFLSCGNFSMQKRVSAKFKHNLTSLCLQMGKCAESTNEAVSWYQNTYDNVRYLSSEHSKWWVRDTAVNSINQVFTAKRKYSIALIKQHPVNIRYLDFTRHEIGKRMGKFKRYDPIIWKYKGELKEIKHNDFVIEYITKLYVFDTEKNLEIFLKFPEKILETKNLPDNLPRKLLLSECGDIYESRIELDAFCIVTLAEEGLTVKGSPIVLASYADKVYSFANSALREKFLKRPQKYEKTKLPVKIPPKADNMVNFVLEEFESSVGFLDQMLGQVIIKALLEVGTQKLLFPLLTPKQTALKHFSLFLKAHNPTNSGYQKEKYSKKLWEFKQHCNLQRDIYEAGVRKENNELKDWEIENYYARGEEYDEFINEISKNIDSFIDKLIR